MIDGCVSYLYCFVRVVLQVNNLNNSLADRLLAFQVGALPFRKQWQTTSSALFIFKPPGFSIHRMEYAVSWFASKPQVATFYCNSNVLKFCPLRHNTFDFRKRAGCLAEMCSVILPRMMPSTPLVCQPVWGLVSETGSPQLRGFPYIRLVVERPRNLALRRPF